MYRLLTIIGTFLLGCTKAYDNDIAAGMAVINGFFLGSNTGEGLYDKVIEQARPCLEIFEEFIQYKEFYDAIDNFQNYKGLGYIMIGVNKIADMLEIL